MEPVIKRPRWKRLLNLAGMILLLPLWLPLYLFIGFLIRLVSKGPILFTYEGKFVSQQRLIDSMEDVKSAE